MVRRLVTLDESGNFEKRKQGKLRFIGGCSKCGEFNLSEEREGIETCLKEACIEFNNANKKALGSFFTKYPESLHMQDKERPCFFWLNVSETMGRNEGGLREKFQEFLQDKILKYLNENDYEIFAFIDANSGYQEYENVASNIIDIDKGANLYERMAILALYNYVFYGIDEENVDEYCFHIATRSLPADNMPDSMYETYGKSSKHASITRTSTYKTAFATKLFDANEDNRYRNIEYKFEVRSTEYKSENDTTPFLYIADIVCSYLNSALKKLNKITSEKLQELMEQLGGLKINVRIYNGLEVRYRHMTECVKNGSLVDYYAEKYELGQSEDEYRELYMKYWSGMTDAFLEKKLKDKEYIKKCIRLIAEEYVKLEGYMGIREYSYNKGIYIAERLIKVLNNDAFRKFSEKDKYLFRSYDICLRGYNHRGDIERTKECIVKCELYRAHVSSEEYIAYILRVMQFYFNTFDYDKIIEFGIKMEKSIRSLKKSYSYCFNAFSEMPEEISGLKNAEPEMKLKLAGKLYSSIGQAFAFSNKYKKSKEYFEHAFNEFAINSPDYLITLSYYLHLLIENGKKQEYQIKAVEYFGSSNLEEQFENIISEKKDFALYVYIKAFNKFYASDLLNSGLLQRILERISEVIEGKSWHPWELICKNLSEIIYKQQSVLNDISKYNWIQEHGLNRITDSDKTVKIIQIGYKIELIKQQCSDWKNDDLSIYIGENNYFSEKEIQLCMELFNLSEGQEELTFFDDFQVFLCKKLTYMYR